MEHAEMLAEARKLANTLQYTDRPRTTGADARTIHKLVALVEQYAAKPIPPSRHAEVIRYARTYATVEAESSNPRDWAGIMLTLCDLVEHLDVCMDECNESIAERVVANNKLADTVKQQDARLAESGKANRHADALTIRGLATLVEKQKTIIVETVAACKACDEAIVRVVSLHQPNPDPDGVLPKQWAGLQAARHQAVGAAKLAEPKGDVDEERLAEVKAEMVDRAVKQIESGDNDFVDADKFKTQCESQPSPPPVAVEMRVQESLTGDGSWTWQCRLGGIWQTMIGTEDALYFGNKGRAQSFASDWLAALSAHLGVPLVAVWKDGE